MQERFEAQLKSVSVHWYSRGQELQAFLDRSSDSVLRSSTAERECAARAMYRSAGICSFLTGRLACGVCGRRDGRMFNAATLRRQATGRSNVRGGDQDL